MKSLCILLVLFAILAVSSAVLGERNTINCCPENSFYTRCASNCQPTCSNPNPGFCRRVCIEGCQCRNGWLISNGRCVLPNQCRTSWFMYNQNYGQQRSRPLQRQLGFI